MRHTILAAGLTLIAGGAVAQTPVLTVYTYDSFIPDWGPGPPSRRRSRRPAAAICNSWARATGRRAVARLRLEGARSEADVVLGLDTNLTAAAAATGLFAPHGIDAEGLTLPVAWDDPLFLPFDWGYFAFVHDKGLEDVPGDFEALAASDVSIVIQDPRSSTPGLGLVMWVEAAYGDRAGEIWAGLADNIVTVTPGWSEAYGLFLEGEADMVLSYTTSPAYHLIAEGGPDQGRRILRRGALHADRGRRHP
jgi:thiamine transport system substrate-binding protein